MNEHDDLRPTSPQRTGHADSTRSRPGAAVDLEGLGHAWAETPALAPISTTIPPGQFVAVIGPSGCGKSTLLRLMAGLDAPSRGRLHIDGTPPDQARRAGMIGWLAQRPALLPWLSVRDNIALPNHVAPGAGTASVDDLLDLVGLAGFGDHLPAELSGGMHQRVGLARTLALWAPLWLMDEPLSALDELTREQLARDIVEIWQRLRPTVVWVTHHLVEAVALADRIIVLSSQPGEVIADLDVTTSRPRDVTTPVHQQVVRRARALLAPHAGTAQVLA